MKYAKCETELGAKNAVAHYKSEGYQAYYICLNAEVYEVRYWGM